VTVTPEPLGRRFPSVSGTSLARLPVRLPDDLSGEPAVLLVAYRRGTQADIDRWTRFLRDAAPAATVLEVPVIPSLVWRPLAGFIDAGMRGGVPSDSWSSVVTVYGDGAALRGFLGDQSGLSAIVLLLDENGFVRWLHTGGFTTAAGRQLLGHMRAPRAAARPADTPAGAEQGGGP
jgi:hypothetical protein